MYILGIDTATKVCGVAVLNEEQLMVEKFLNNQKTHSQNIMPLIKQAIEEAGIKPKDLGGIAVTKGPGSFTGLRIGMTIAKSLAQVLNIPIIGVSTLESLALNVLGVPGLICPILDARKNQVYAAVYYDRVGKLEMLEEPMAVALDDLLSKLKKFDREVTFLGDAVPVYGSVITEVMGPRALFAGKINSLPRAAATAELGMAMLQLGVSDDPLRLTPFYIRASEAETTWARKHAGLNGEN